MLGTDDEGRRPHACFKVERVVGVMNEGNVRLYQVQWAPSWVSGFHLVGCEHLIDEYIEGQHGDEQRHDEQQQQRQDLYQYEKLFTKPIQQQQQNNDQHQKRTQNEPSNPQQQYNTNIVIPRSPLMDVIPHSTGDLNDGDCFTGQCRVRNTEYLEHNEIDKHCSNGDGCLIVVDPSCMEEEEERYANDVDGSFTIYQENQQQQDGHLSSPSTAPQLLYIHEGHHSTNGHAVEQYEYESDHRYVVKSVDSDLVGTHTPTPEIKETFNGVFIKVEDEESSAVENGTLFVSQPMIESRTDESPPPMKISNTYEMMNDDDTTTAPTSFKTDSVKPSLLWGPNNHEVDEDLEKKVDPNHKFSQTSTTAKQLKNPIEEQNTDTTTTHHNNTTTTEIKPSTTTPSRMKHTTTTLLGLKHHTCTVCSKQFRYKSELTLHFRKHTGAKPYCCTYCHQAFSHRSNLKRHVRTHTGDRPYVCDVCGKKFSQSGSLKNHVRTHSETCGYSMVDT